MLRTAVGVTLASINQPFSNPKMDAVLADEKLAVLAKLDVRENTSKILNFVKEKISHQISATITSKNKLNLYP